MSVDGVPYNKTQSTQDWSQLESLSSDAADALRTPPPAAASSNNGKERADADDATEVIASCRDDMKALWEDKAVQALFQKHNICLQDSAVGRLVSPPPSLHLPFYAASRLIAASSTIWTA